VASDIIVDPPPSIEASTREETIILLTWILYVASPHLLMCHVVNSMKSFLWLVECGAPHWDLGHMHSLSHYCFHLFRSSCSSYLIGGVRALNDKAKSGQDDKIHHGLFSYGVGDMKWEFQL
jgi:hypothetical protein